MDLSCNSSDMTKFQQNFFVDGRKRKFEKCLDRESEIQQKIFSSEDNPYKNKKNKVICKKMLGMLIDPDLNRNEIIKMNLLNMHRRETRHDYDHLMSMLCVKNDLENENFMEMERPNFNRLHTENARDNRKIYMERLVTNHGKYLKVAEQKQNIEPEKYQKIVHEYIRHQCRTTLKYNEYSDTVVKMKILENNIIFYDMDTENTSPKEDIEEENKDIKEENTT